MIRTLLILVLIAITFSIKLREPSNANTTEQSHQSTPKENEDKVSEKKYIPNEKIKVNGTGIELENCHAYGINSQYINFGCTECKSGSKLLMDPNGIGICQKETGVVNCDKSIQFSTESKLTCIECTNGMALSDNGGKCLKLNITITPEGNKTEIIPNCKQYTINSIGKIKCSKCISGFSLSDDMTDCNEKCNITDCDNCFENNLNQYCYSCKPGLVGIIGYPFNTITKCISAKKWMDNLFSPLVREFILD